MAENARTRYVNWKEILQIVKGHEGEVLDRVGVSPSWRTGGEIDCPYPRHRATGQKNWRFKEREGRAYCPCIGRHPEDEGKRFHTVFNVVATIEGISFEAAKVRVAEILGRADLIKTKSSGSIGAAGGTRSDPASLLSPPDDKRDDTIAPNYLSSRLGIDPSEVPRPTTKVVGWNELSYYDQDDAKPILIGKFAAAVFEQIDGYGNTHAHRIYTAPGGHGKANLGTRADGAPRDVKKSALVTDGSRTTGRSVLWGNPDTATGVNHL
jgi:hypothetical protein